MNSDRIAPAAELPPRVEALCEDAFAYVQPPGSWFINNAGFVRSGNGVYVIDTCATERRTRALQSAIAATTGDEPVLGVINTHHHGDHTHGNWLFAPAPIIGTPRCRDLVLQTGIARYDDLFEPPEWGELHLAPPTVTFEDRLAMWPGTDRELQLLACPDPAHSASDVVVWMPGPRILFAGDLIFNGVTPFAAFGSIAGWLRALDWLRVLDPAVVVPGHGPVGDASTIDAVSSYLALLQGIAEDALVAEMSPLQAARVADLGPHSSLSERERIVANLYRAMAEVQGRDEIDVSAAVLDTLAYNGGRRLTTRA